VDETSARRFLTTNVSPNGEAKLWKSPPTDRLRFLGRRRLLIAAWVQMMRLPAKHTNRPELIPSLRSAGPRNQAMPTISRHILLKDSW
jgi:hypothetical protein